MVKLLMGLATMICCQIMIDGYTTMVASCQYSLIMGKIANNNQQDQICLVVKIAFNHTFLG